MPEPIEDHLLDTSVDVDVPPPFLRTWPRVYAVVILLLVLQIILLGLFTLSFR